MSQSSRICSDLYALARTDNGCNVEIELSGVPVLVIQRIEDADQILRLNAANYRKNMAWFRQALGASRFSEDGRAWKIRRDLTQSYFTKFDRENTFALSRDYAGAALDQMAFQSETADVLSDDTLREMTAGVLLDNFFGLRLKETGIDLGLLARLMEYGSEYSFVPQGQTSDLYRSRLSLLPELRRQVLKSLEIFRSDAMPENSMLDGMLAADRSPTERVVLEHELMTFLAAGAETSAATMGWACYLLGKYPEVQEELRFVARSFWASAEPSWSRLSTLRPLARFISETLRLYPPTPIIARLANGPDRIGSRQIEADQNVMISFIGLQHDRRFRNDPWMLDIHDDAAQKGSGESMAFSIGPRICGGKNFALVELVTFLSVFLSRARFELTSSEPPVYHWKSQMLRDGGQPVKVLPLHDI